MKRRKRRRNKHHLTPKSRGGNCSASNLAYWDEEFHAKWHGLFGNRTLEEVIALLIRFARMKGR